MDQNAYPEKNRVDASSPRREYLLLNKDVPILRFFCERDEYGEIKTEEIAWLSEWRPIGYKTLQTFLERRRAPKHRKHIESLLERYGCEDLENFIRITHALSLNDTFWIKEGSSPLCWNEVSLYRNEFNEIISQAAFDGIISETSMSSTSPEFGTDGRYAKCWVREDQGIFLYKSGSATYEIEPLSEYLASQISQKLCPDAVQYDLSFYHGTLVSKCPLFTDEEHGLAKVSDLNLADKSIAGLLAFFDGIGSGDAFRRMCVLDAVVLNVDRHLGNFGVYFNTDTMEIERMAPIYDHNRSLLFDLDQAQFERAEWYIQKCKPRIGTDFISTAKGLLTDSIRNDLKNLRGFRFEQHKSIQTEQWRIDKLSDIVNFQIEKILR